MMMTGLYDVLHSDRQKVGRQCVFSCAIPNVRDGRTNECSPPTGREEALLVSDFEGESSTRFENGNVYCSSSWGSRTAPQHLDVVPR